MNKQPIFFRSMFAILVTVVFIWSMYPLQQQDIFKVFEQRLKKKDANIEKVLKVAKEKNAKGMYAISALDEAATETAVDLNEYFSVKNAVNNRDVINYLREQASGSIRRGIDINGGVEFYLKLLPKEDDSGNTVQVSDVKFAQYRDAAIEIIRNRLESQKIYETEISPAGADYISLKAPIVSRDEKLKLLNLIKMSAKLEFCLVHPNNDKLVAEYSSLPEEERAKYAPPNGYKIMKMLEMNRGKKPQTMVYFIKARPEMTGKNVTSAGPSMDNFGQRLIHLGFNSSGAKEFGKVTRENVNRQLAIILDGTLYSAPNIQQAIEGGQAQITGQFSKEEAENISNALISGSLPVRIDVQGVFDTDPTLGETALKNSLLTGLVSFIMVCLFMLIYYRKAGLVANVALVLNIVLLLGGFAAFNCTLTLAGIAGIILTIGMAVDANVLIYERIREELGHNKTLASAVESGFDRAFLTILDSNLTTILIGIILMWQGTGAIKGFAIALTIGVSLNLFTSLFVTRLLFDIMAKYTDFRTLTMLKFFSRPNIDFLKLSKVLLPATTIVALVFIGMCCYKGTAIFGIDFTGGTLLTYEYNERINETTVGDELVKAGYPAPKVSYKTNIVQNSKIIEIVIPPAKGQGVEGKSKDLSSHEQVMTLLNKAFPKSEFKGGEEVTIGGLIGWEFSKKAFLAFIFAIIGMIIYLTLRFEFAYGCAAMVALIHDIIIAVGFYVVFCNGEISLQVVAAALTILGFSVNDTIIVFDRIREDVGLVKNKTYHDIINLSINQTLSRTIITSFTVFLVTLIMYVMGGNNLKDFVIVMLVGVVVGTYSSAFIASPIISIWHKRLGLNLVADQKEDNKVAVPVKS
ncbi:MAG TPA: hypothetical protein DET40_10310 [Lentisphaeria bacterium]|nr:MAG: hypothetical protein A2X45_09970 [Lentisphaerae bacterium GWF2_50_93]HCE43929.1 hypothetical protein [Lentisphaeria bacterium]